ncbi:MAG: DUF4249 domain-containing protein [Clostridiales bacterium]|jgi:hypothetical protein|nr:DUF4249 domain-containing protein [Clostridiales bacterium]
MKNKNTSLNPSKGGRLLPFGQLRYDSGKFKDSPPPRMSSLRDLFICCLLCPQVALRYTCGYATFVPAGLSNCNLPLTALLQRAKRNAAGVKLCITVCKRSAAYGTKQKTAKSRMGRHYKDLTLMGVRESVMGLLLLLIVLTSCRKEVKNEFENYPISPAVNCLLLVDKPVQMYLSLTGTIKDTEFPKVENAQVFLYVNGDFAEELTHQGEGLYQSVLLVEEEKLYSCKVFVPDFDTIYCQNVIPKSERLLSLTYIPVAGLDEDRSHPALDLVLTNNPHKRSYYEVKIHFFVNGNSGGVGILPQSSDPVIMREGIPIAVFSNEGMHDTIYKLRLGFRSSHYSSSPSSLREKFFVELHSINYDYYQYLRTSYLYERGRYSDPLESYPPMNIYSNIVGGYGIFSGYSFVQSDTVYLYNVEDL